MTTKPEADYVRLIFTLDMRAGPRVDAVQNTLARVAATFHGRLTRTEYADRGTMWERLSGKTIVKRSKP